MLRSASGAAETTPPFDSNPPQPQNDNVHIADQRFMTQLNRLIVLRDFLLDQKFPLYNQSEILNLGDLNSLVYSKKGRSPVHREWEILENKTLAILCQFDEQLRRKYILKSLGFFFGVLPIIFLTTCVLSTISWLIVVQHWPIDVNEITRGIVLLLNYAVWVLSQGGLGACAFIGTQLIANPIIIEKSTSQTGGDARPSEVVNLTDKNYLKMRIVLGSLFSFLLCFPIARVIMGKIDRLFLYESTTSVDVNDISLILIPFIIGFSTSLVLTILNRFIAAIQEFFGASGRRT